MWVGTVVGGVKRDDRAGVKDVGGKRERHREVGLGGFALTFTSAYVKMLSLSPSQVLPLQMPELSVRSGLSRGAEGGRGRGEEVWERFHFKQAQLCHTVT